MIVFLGLLRAAFIGLGEAVAVLRDVSPLTVVLEGLPRRFGISARVTVDLGAGAS